MNVTDGAARPKAATPTFAERIRHWLPASLLGLVLGSLFGLLVAWRSGEHPMLLSAVVFALVSGPVIAVGLQALWFDRTETDRAIASGAHDVERAWATEAAATAFWTLMGGLVAMDTIGGALRLSWLSPIGMTHVVLLGAGTFAVSYLWLRRRGQ